MERSAHETRRRNALLALGAFLLFASGIWAGSLLQRGAFDPSEASAGPEWLFARRAPGLGLSPVAGPAAVGHLLGGGAPRAKRLEGRWWDYESDDLDTASATRGGSPAAAHYAPRHASEEESSQAPRRTALKAWVPGDRGTGSLSDAAPYAGTPQPASRFEAPSPKAWEAVSGGARSAAHGADRLTPVPGIGGVKELKRRPDAADDASRSAPAGTAGVTDETVYQIQTDRSKAFAIFEGKGPHQGAPPPQEEAATASRVELGGGSGGSGNQKSGGPDGASPR